MEIKMLHMLELGSSGREQFLGGLDGPVHGTADIEEQQHFYRVVPLGAHQDVEIAFMRGTRDGAVEVELVGRAGARKFAQPTQPDLYVTRAKLDLIVEILEL